MEYTFVSTDYCPVCSHSEHTPFYHREMRQELFLQFSKCQRCEALFQNPKLSIDTLQTYFNSPHFIGESGNQPTETDIGYYDYADWEKSYQKNADSILNLLSRYIPPPASLLEIGGATGWFANQAQKTGYDVSGLDISERLAKQVKERHGINVLVSSIENASFADESFDVICSFGGIACWYDPQAAFVNIRRMLKKGGIFCFNYTCHDSITAKLRGNKFFEYNLASLIIYNQKAMHRLLKERGFSILEEKTQWQKASIGRILSYLKFQTLYQITKQIGVADLVVLVPAIGTHLIVVRREEDLLKA